MPKPVHQKMIDRARETHMHDVIETLKMDPPKGDKICAWDRSETEPSVHIYDDHWWDFGTGRGGDQIAFVQEVLDVSFPKAVKILCRQVPATPGVGTEKARRRATDMTEEWEKGPAPTDKDIGRLMEMCRIKWPTLTPRKIMSFSSVRLKGEELHTAHFHVINNLKRRVPVGVKIRNLVDGSKYSVKGSVFTEGFYYPHRQPTGSALVLVEGESDAWALDRHLLERGVSDVTVAGLPSGANMFRAEWLDPFSSYLWVALDGDEAGRKAADKIGRAASERALEYADVIPPGGRLAEALGDGWDFPLGFLSP